MAKSETSLYEFGTSLKTFYLSQAYMTKKLASEQQKKDDANKSTEQTSKQNKILQIVEQKKEERSYKPGSEV